MITRNVLRRQAYPLTARPRAWLIKNVPPAAEPLSRVFDFQANFKKSRIKPWGRAKFATPSAAKRRHLLPMNAFAKIRHSHFPWQHQKPRE